MTPAQLSGLFAIGVSAVSVSTLNNLTLSVAQTTALEGSKISLSLQSGYSVFTISDSAAQIATLTTTQLEALAALHVTQISATDATVSLTVAQATALEGCGSWSPLPPAPRSCFPTRPSIWKA